MEALGVSFVISMRIWGSSGTWFLFFWSVLHIRGGNAVLNLLGLVSYKLSLSFIYSCFRLLLITISGVGEEEAVVVHPWFGHSEQLRDDINSFFCCLNEQTELHISCRDLTNMK